MKEYIKKLLREGLIVEGASPIVYHFTNINRLLNILGKDEMYLTPTISSSNEKRMSGNKFYFLSLSRTKSITQGYGTQFTNPNSVRIKFDGNKLNTKYKVKPIDYWQYPKTKDFMGGSGDEMEDRLVSDKGTIPNVNNYIISIDIFIGNDGIDERIISLAKSLGIKINLFNNKQDFASGNEMKAVNDIKMLNNTEKPFVPEVQPYQIINILGALSYKNETLLKDIISQITNKFNQDNEFVSKLSDGVKEYQDKLDYYLKPYYERYIDDYSTSLNSDLHNSKTSGDDLIRYITNEFIKVYKSLNANSVKDFFNKLMYRGKKTQTDFNNEFNDDMIKFIDKMYLVELENSKFGAYDVSGEYWDNIFEDKYIKNFLFGKLNEIKKYVSNFILNNDDMYKYNYKLSKDEISDAINLKDGNNLKNILEVFDDVTYDEIIRPIQYLLYSVDDFRYEKIKKLQDENENQWNQWGN